MKDNTKITLSFCQLKKLISESKTIKENYGDKNKAYRLKQFDDLVRYGFYDETKEEIFSLLDKEESEEIRDFIKCACAYAYNEAGQRSFSIGMGDDSEDDMTVDEALADVRDELEISNAFYQKILKNKDIVDVVETCVTDGISDGAADV